MSKQTAVAVVVSFALAVAVGAAISSRQATLTTTEAGAATETSVTAPRHAVFFNEHETVVGPAVIVAKEPRLDGTQLVVDFEIMPLAPIADAPDLIQYAGFGSTQVVAPADLNTVFIDDWSLNTPTLEIQGTVSNPAARTVRFEVDADFDVSTVTDLAIDSYALLTPVDTSIVLGAGTETAQVAPGVSAHLLAITEQANAIVQIELKSQRHFNLDAIAVTGEGPGWLSGVREAEGRPRWNLTYDSTQAPDPIGLRVAGSVWITVSDHIPVKMEVSE